MANGILTEGLKKCDLCPMIRPINPDELWLTREVAYGFFSESKLPGAIAFEHWMEHWSRMLLAGIGGIFCQFKEERVVGIIGGYIFPCTMTGKMEGIEAFWYVMMEGRGGTGGIKLLLAFEDWVREKGGAWIKMSSLSSINPDGMKSLFHRLNYSEIQTSYIKEL